VRIDSYSFGLMKIQGQQYRTDLILFPDKVSPNWWRKQGHSLAKEDIKEILDFKPDVLVIGTGASGLMQVPRSVLRILKDEGIQVISKKTGEACNLFNEQLKKGKRVVGAFHLTC